MPKRTPTSPLCAHSSSSATHLPHTTRTVPSVKTLLQRVQAQSVHALTHQEVQLLQRTVGNSVVQRMFAGTEPVLQLGRRKRTTNSTTTTTTTTTPTKKDEHKAEDNDKGTSNEESLSAMSEVDSDEVSSEGSSHKKQATESLDSSKEKPSTKKHYAKKKQDVSEEDALEDRSASKKTAKQKVPPTPIKTTKEGANSLRRSGGRNKKRKSFSREGEKEPHLWKYQAYYNYSDLGEKQEFDVKDKDDKFHLYGGMHTGKGGQPNFTTREADFKGSTVDTDYDSLVESLAATTDFTEDQVAQMALDFIKDGTPLPLKDEQFHALNSVILLTQIIEPHKTRLPGTDKWARASLRRIGNQDSSFQEEFNRTDGNFLPARAAGDKQNPLSGHTGQSWGRAAFGTPKPNDFHFTEEQIFTPGVNATLDELSDDSMEDVEEKTPARPPVRDKSLLPQTPKGQSRKKTKSTDSDDGDWEKTAEGKDFTNRDFDEDSAEEEAVKPKRKTRSQTKKRKRSSSSSDETKSKKHKTNVTSEQNKT